MNIIVTNALDILHQTEAMRGQLLDMLTDADLAYKLPGDNAALGVLFRASGQVEQSYIDSFKTFKQSWDFPAVDPALETSVAKLRMWYQALDQELDAVLIALTDDEIQNHMIDRGFPMSAGAQMHTYREALLIFYGKVTCYFRAMGKPLPDQVRGWVG